MGSRVVIQCWSMVEVGLGSVAVLVQGQWGELLGRDVQDGCCHQEVVDGRRVVVAAMAAEAASIQDVDVSTYGTYSMRLG